MTSYSPYQGRPAWPRAKVRAFIEDMHAAIAQGDSYRMGTALAMAPRSGRILDFGCGWGCMTRAMANEHANITGIDTSEDALEIARDFNSHPGITYENKELSDYAAGTFTAITATQSMEHVHNPSLVLLEMYRILSPGGVVVFSIPNPATIYQVVKQMIRGGDAGYYSALSRDVRTNYRPDEQHVNSWLADDFVILMAACGFEYVGHRPAGGVHIPWLVPRHSWLPLFCTHWRTRLWWVRSASYATVWKFKKAEDPTESEER